MNFKILSLNAYTKTMVIDWGYTVLNHGIPIQILENPNISEAETIDIIEAMRPEKPQPIELPIVLINLSSQGQGIDSETVIESEVTI